MPDPEGAGGRYAQVIVDIASGETDRVFTYRVPAGMELLPGTRVSVPFGKRTMEGVVLSFSSEAGIPEDKVRDILHTLEDYPVVLPPLVALAKEIARDTRTPLAMALRLMFPAEMRRGRVKVRTRTAARLRAGPDDLQAALGAAEKASSRAPKRKLLLKLLSDGLSHPVEELKLLARNPLDALKSLADDGFVELSEEEVFRSPYPDSGPVDRDPALTADQREVLSEIIPAIRAGSGKFLLHGITGSGKTEVYIRAARECLSRGQGVIVLIPEIVLTPQMVMWFRGRFGDVAAVLHSRLSAGERFDEWRRIRTGHARIVIGARSAVFAPVTNLGLIVVDEEHEATYQAENAPRYDAREVAASRAKREGAALILASATPSVLTFAKARRGDLMLLEMRNRVLSQPLAHVTVVDMREELRLGNRGMFSSLLQQRLEECLSRNQQAMLFLNRRGYAPSVMCRKCGTVMKCPQCDVNLTWHQADRLLHCHYCGLRSRLPETCPACGSSYLKPVGTGTQKVEEELLRLYPNLPVVRLDLDTTSGKDAHQTLLDRFRSGEARVMVGTQMIAKGHDFPQVTLVAAILADMSLHLPDYRSQERTFQLLTQLAGRAGRADMPGEVVIQTYAPEHFAIQAAARQDYRAFFEQEFARRRQKLYPPFTMMVRLLCEHAQEDVARGVSTALFTRLEEWLQQHPNLRKRVIFHREDASPIKRIMGFWRTQVLLKLLEHPESGEVLDFLKQLSEETWPCRVSLEVNPASLA